MTDVALIFVALCVGVLIGYAIGESEISRLRAALKEARRNDQRDARGRFTKAG